MITNEELHANVIAIYSIDEQIRTLKKMREKPEQTIRDNVAEGGYVGFDDGFSVTIELDAITHPLDQKLLKADHPALYQDYLKTSTRKGRIRVTAPKEEK